MRYYKKWRRRRYRKKAKPKTKVDKSLDRRIRALEKAPEKKWFDTSNGYLNIPSEPANTLVPLNIIPPGTTSVTRIGSQVTSVLLGVKLSIRQVSTSLVENRVRFFVFWFKEQNGLVPTIGDLFDLTIAPLTFAFRNRYVIEDYSLLKDKVIELMPATMLTATSVVPGVRHFEFQIPMKKIIQFNSINGGTAADIEENGLWFGITTAAATDNPQLALDTRFIYTDT